ncbi:MAG: sugar kinase [Streptosporangiales bacterium]|nr:sugar kinase [Streptosporangiales bacterium]
MLGVLGDLLEDIVVWLAEPLQQATDTDVEMHRTRGGSAANVAMFAARHYPTRFIGCVGDDHVGTGVVADLAAHGVDVKVQRRGSTGTVVVLVDEHGERTMLPHQAAGALLADLDPSWLDGLAHLHVTAYSLTAEPVAGTAADALATLRDRGATTSVDVSSTGLMRRYGRDAFRDRLADLRPNLLFANAEEAAFLDLTADGAPGQGLAALPHTVVVVKDGSRPTTVLAPGAPPVRVDVPPVSGVRDLTGAGDAFAAGFLTAYLSRAGLPAACAQGHACAATVLAHPGATADS